MPSYLNVAIVKIPFRSRVMGFSNNRPGIVGSHGKGDLRLATVVLGIHRRYATSKPAISGEEMHTLIKFMVSVMASNIVDGL